MVYTLCFIMFFYVLRPWLYSRFQSRFTSLDSLLNASPYDTDHLIFRVDTNNQNDLILSYLFYVISHPSYATNRGRIVKYCWRGNHICISVCTIKDQNDIATNVWRIASMPPPYKCNIYVPVPDVRSQVLNPLLWLPRNCDQFVMACLIFSAMPFAERCCLLSISTSGFSFDDIWITTQNLHEIIKCLHFSDQSEEDTLDEDGRYTSVENTSEINLSTINISYLFVEMCMRIMKHDNYE